MLTSRTFMYTDNVTLTVGRRFVIFYTNRSLGGVVQKYVGIRYTVKIDIPPTTTGEWTEDIACGALHIVLQVYFDTRN